ncbi:MAG: pentapeptide repeat-containing protein [Anaerolineaceae bacterium]
MNAKNRSFIDQAATFINVALWLIVTPLLLSYGAISSMSTRNKDSVWASWLLVPIALILLFVVRRKLQTAWARNAILAFSLVFLVLPIVTNWVSWNYFTHCADRVGPQAELQYCDFTGHAFNGQDLSSANLTNATLNEASFRNANLSGATFTHAVLGGTDFTGAILERAVFDQTDISAALGLTPEMLHALSSWQGVKTGETPAETLQIMAAVCQGQGYGSAMPYVPGSITAETAPYTLFAIGDTTDYEIQGSVSGKNELSSWQKSLSVFTPLTACFREDYIQYEICYYENGTHITRKRQIIAVDLRATLTGEIIESTHFYAKQLPPPCPDEISSSGFYDLTSRIDFRDVDTWLNDVMLKP